MRGKEYFASSMVAAMGITPAYAGKSDTTPTRYLTAKDHPRVCGEKPDAECPHHDAEGSPPHMRGKARGARFSDVVSGITPAHAGKSLTREILLIVSRDHPRACGEKARRKPVSDC